MTGFDDELRGALHDDAWALPAPADPQGWVRARVRRRRARALVAGAAAVGLLATGAVAVVGGGGGSAGPEQLNGPAQVAPTVPRPAECPVVPAPSDPLLLPEPCWFAYAPLNEAPARPSPPPVSTGPTGVAPSRPSPALPTPALPPSAPASVTPPAPTVPADLRDGRSAPSSALAFSYRIVDQDGPRDHPRLVAGRLRLLTRPASGCPVVPSELRRGAPGELVMGFARRTDDCRGVFQSDIWVEVSLDAGPVVAPTLLRRSTARGVEQFGALLLAESQLVPRQDPRARDCGSVTTGFDVRPESEALSCLESAVREGRSAVLVDRVSGTDSGPDVVLYEVVGPGRVRVTQDSRDAARITPGVTVNLCRTISTSTGVIVQGDC